MGKASQEVLGRKSGESKALGQADVGSDTRAVGPVVSRRVPPSLSMSIVKWMLKDLLFWIW